LHPSSSPPPPPPPLAKKCLHSWRSHARPRSSLGKACGPIALLVSLPLGTGY
jgi:hypothetical protein